MLINKKSQYLNMLFKCRSFFGGGGGGGGGLLQFQLLIYIPFLKKVTVVSSIFDENQFSWIRLLS